MTQYEDSEAIQIVPDPDKLDRYHRQQLSAMLDGELSPDQARFMLRRLQHDADLAGRWERWQVCGDVLRGQRNALLPPDFSQKVAAAIAADGSRAPSARPQAAAPRLLRWGGGAALAASVAMAALLVGRQAGIEPEPAPARLQPRVAASQPAPVSPAPAIDVPAPAQSPSLADGTAVIAGTALAAAEAPRPAAARRAPDRQAPAAARVVEPAGPAPAVLAVATAPPVAEPPVAAKIPAEESGGALFAGLAAAGDGVGSDPFASLPMIAASRPWPRAEGPGSGYSVGLGGMGELAPAWPALTAPRPTGPAERFGLPPAVPRLSAATAFGAQAVGGGASEPGPR